MKKYITLTLIFTLVTSLTFAQKTVQAEDIMKDLKAGKDVVISNATVEGILDFTFMDEKLEDLPKRKKSWFWNNGGDKKVKKLIETKVSFTNVTFEDDVLAYIPDGDNSGYTFVANFEKDAMFVDCTFKRKAMFKYSRFEQSSSFKNAKFNDDSTFKYAVFDNNTSFENAKFDYDSTFKYTKFKTYVSFANSNFEETATFKYTEFKDGVSFKNANFEEDLDLKYTQVKGKFDASGMKVAYDIDSKYTKINGKSFTRHLIDN